MDLHLDDEQAELLLAELDGIIEYDRYPLSPRIQALREIRALVKPYPERPPPSAPQPHLEPPSRGQYRKGDDGARGGYPGCGASAARSTRTQHRTALGAALAALVLPGSTVLIPRRGGGDASELSRSATGRKATAAVD
jgi:hypothetical protein